MLRFLASLILIPLLTQCTTAQMLKPKNQEARLGNKIIPMNIITPDNQCIVIATGTLADGLATIPCTPGLRPNWAITELQTGIMLKHSKDTNEWLCLRHQNNVVKLGPCDKKRQSVWKKVTLSEGNYNLETQDGFCLTQVDNTVKLLRCDSSDLKTTFQLNSNRVKVTGGEVAGLQFGKTARFMGIPYSKPPIKKRRFMPPEPLDKHTWDGPMLAFNPSFMCPQTNFRGDYFGREDCLTLNIWAPQNSVVSGAHKPVMVWIHGGGMARGGAYYELPGRSKNYNGRALSELGDVLIVSINYRLGTLGLLGTRGKFKGNNSLKDQIAALNWIHNNIASFGGDPGNITIFGESAGAWSVCALLAAPKASPLFHKAIMESGACTSTTLADHNAANEWMIKQLDCWENGAPAAQEKCLMQVPAKTLAQRWVLNRPKSIELAKVFVIAPYVDGETLPIAPLEALAKGKINKPLINGTDKEELANLAWLLSLLGVIDFDNAHTLEALVEKPEAKAYVAPALTYYKKQGKDEGDIIDDVLFNCINWQLANGMASRKQMNYSYLLDMPVIFDVNVHTEGLPYVFQQIKSPVSRDIGLRWTHFARTGSPNIDSLTHWSNQRSGALKQLKIDKNPKIIKWEEKETCKLLQQFLPWTVIGRNAGWIPATDQISR